MKVAELAPGSEHCDEIAWAADGYRVGFVINGYQRASSMAPLVSRSAGQSDEPDGTPSAHVARRNASQNGAAADVRWCPGLGRGKSGLAAVR